MTQNSKQSQNNKTKMKKKKKSKKSVSDFHNSCNVKKERETN